MSEVTPEVPEQPGAIVIRDRSNYKKKEPIPYEPNFKFDAVSEEAVMALAEGELSAKAICQKLNIGMSTLMRWKANPTFAANVEATRKKYAELILEHGLARQEVRIAKAQERADKLNRVIEARAEHYKKRQEAGEEIPGGETGLVYEKRTQFGTELRVDIETPRELREHEKQIAQDLGQWQDKGGNQVAVQIVYPATAPNREAVEAATVTIGVKK